MSPTVRKRTERCSTTSPSRGGVSSVTGNERRAAADHRARVRKVDRRDREPLARDVLPHVELGPVARSGTRGRSRPGACARCRGSTAPAAGSSDPTGRTRRGRRRSAPWRAPSPRRGARRRCRRRSRIPRSRRAASPTDARCGSPPGASARRDPRAIESSTVRTISRSPSSAARRSRNAMTSGKLWPVSMCSSGNGKRPGAERLLGEPQQDQRILAAREEQGGVAALARDLAQDVDRLGLEPAEVVGIGGRHRRRAPRPPAARESSASAVMASRLRRPRRWRRRHARLARGCSPHSLCSGDLPPPAAGADVLARLDGARAGRAADGGISAVVQRVVRHVVGAEVRPDVVGAPVGERIELRDAVHGVEFLDRRGRRASPTARGAGR